MRKALLINLIILLGLVSFVSSDISDLLVGIDTVYNFEQDPSTSDLIDQVGNNDSTSDTNIVRVSGINKLAWNFSTSVSTSVALPKTVLDDRDKFTLSCWVNVSEYNGDRGAIFYGSTGGGVQTGLWRVNSPDRFVVALTTSFGGDVTFPFTVPVNNWFQLGLTYDGSTMIAYLNGTAQGNFSSSGLVDTSGNVDIGFSSAAGYRDNAVIDECYLWDYAVSGQNLSDIKIEIGLPGGAHADFCKIVEQVKEVNAKYKYGYDLILESLGSFEVGNWSELLAKCAILLPYAHKFKIKLTPKPGSGGLKANPWS